MQAKIGGTIAVENPVVITQIWNRAKNFGTGSRPVPSSDYTSLLAKPYTSVHAPCEMMTWKHSYHDVTQNRFAVSYHDVTQNRFVQYSKQLQNTPSRC